MILIVAVAEVVIGSGRIEPLSDILVLVGELARLFLFFVCCCL